MSHKTNLKRRRFLQQLAIAAGSTSLMGYKGKLDLMQSALASTSALPGGSKSLVCIFLYGGNDAFNMFVPYDDTRHQQYADSRQNLAIAQADLLPIATGDYGFHPSLGGLRDLYDDGRLGVIANVGNLIVPTTREEYLNRSVPLPISLFSHSHQQELWQTNRAPATTVATAGWGGRMADLLQPANSNPLVPVAYSTTGNNLWEAAESTRYFSLDSRSGAKDFKYLSGASSPTHEPGRTAAWDEILAFSQENALAAQMSATFTSTRERVAQIQSGLELTDPDAGGYEILTPYDSNSSLSRQLRMIARMIYARDSLGQQRQIFFAAAGGWDTHGNQLNTHNSRYADLGAAMADFQATLAEFSTLSGKEDTENSVLTFTASEFGRTLTSNGDGTDHGWGSHAMIMGGAVNGATVYGDFPSMVLGSENDSGSNGRMIPGLSVDQYGATIARWMGLSEAEIAEIFPNLVNFNSNDLGFIS